MHGLTRLNDEFEATSRSTEPPLGPRGVSQKRAAANVRHVAPLRRR